MRAVSLMAWVSWLLASHSVAAQDAMTTSEPPVVATEEPASVPDAQEGEARALFHAGQSAYEAGRFEKALEYFLQAHELSGRPALLYNIGQAADRARRDETALNAFRMFLQQVPDAPNAAMVQNRIASLEIAVDNAHARSSLIEPTPSIRPAPVAAVEQTSTAAPTTVDREARPLHSQWWLWGGIGAAVVVTVIVIAAVSSGGDDDVARPPAGSDGVVVLTLGGP